MVLSSMGVNNMGATLENEHLLSEMLSRSCFYAVSVRENPALFRKYASGCSYEIIQVCDPAAWSEYIYHSHLAKKAVRRAKASSASMRSEAVCLRTTASRGSSATR